MDQGVSAPWLVEQARAVAERTVPTGQATYDFISESRALLYRLADALAAAEERLLVERELVTLTREEADAAAAQAARWQGVVNYLVNTGVVERDKVNEIYSAALAREGV